MMRLLTHILPRKVFSHGNYMLLLLFVIFCVQVSAPSFSYASGIKASFSIQPATTDMRNQQPQSYFIFNSMPAKLIYSRVRIMNTGTARGTANIYAVDATTSANGGVTYLSHTIPHHNVGNWVVLSQLRLTLNAGQSQDVSFRLAVPRNVSSGQYIGGIVVENITLQNATSPTTRRSINIKLHVKQLSVAPIVINVPGRIEERLSTSGVHFDSTNPFQRVLISLSNAGNVIIRPKGSATITDVRGRIMQRTQLNMNTFLPRTSIQYPLNIIKKALPAGIYRVWLALDYGKYRHNTLNATFLFLVRKIGKPLATVASQVVQSPDDFLHSLALWQYGLAGVVLLLVGSALFFWMQKGWVMFGKSQQKNGAHKL